MTAPSVVRPRVLVARAVFPETLERLAPHFELRTNQDDEVWSKARLSEQLQGCVGAFTTGSERIDADVLAANPQLRICANMAKFDRSMSRQAMRVETLTPPKANPVARPHTLLCYVVVQGMPTPSNAAAVDLGGWIRSANVQLEAWAAACRIRSAALSLLSVENTPKEREIMAAECSSGPLTAM